MRLTVTVTDEHGTVLDSGEVLVEGIDDHTSRDKAIAAISEANWFMEAGIGWPDLDPNNDKK